jgi:hypothetical protein
MKRRRVAGCRKTLSRECSPLVSKETNERSERITALRVSAVFALVGIKMRVLKTRRARAVAQLGGGWMGRKVRTKNIVGRN